MENGDTYTNDIYELAKNDVFHFFDKSFYDRWNLEVREVLIMMSGFESFTVKMAEMVTGNEHVPNIIEEAIEVGNFLMHHGNGVYSYRMNLRMYLQWKEALIYR